MSDDPIYSPAWRDWILIVRRQLGIIDTADLIYVRSQLYQDRRIAQGHLEVEAPVLFGLAEGKIAQANRRKDPLYLFAAMQRHLGYPAVPRLEAQDPLPTLVPQLLRRMERLEARIKLFEDEQRGGIDITKFYKGGRVPPPADDLID